MSAEFKENPLKGCRPGADASVSTELRTFLRCVSWDHSDKLREERTIMEDHIEEIEINSKRDKGFTLVELLIVIVILGILATVTVFAVRGITNKGQDSACKATAKTYETAIEAFYAQNTDTANPHPSGPELVTMGLIRSYDGTDVAISEATGAVTGTNSSQVVNGTSGKCSSLFPAPN
jgi:prepilin-type N-terminal cleavage/methylation domain-containing protein